jgi:hypothetical protein
MGEISEFPLSIRLFLKAYRWRRIGSLNVRHLSFMGSITAPGRFQRDVVPEAARLFEVDAVDAALLVPV